MKTKYLGQIQFDATGDFDLPFTLEDWGTSEHILVQFSADTVGSGNTFSSAVLGTMLPDGTGKVSLSTVAGGAGIHLDVPRLRYMTARVSVTVFGAAGAVDVWVRL